MLTKDLSMGERQLFLSAVHFADWRVICALVDWRVILAFADRGMIYLSTIIVLVDHSTRGSPSLLGKDPPIGGNDVLRKSIISANLGYICRLAVFVHNNDSICRIYR